MFTPTQQDESEDDYNERKRRYELGMPWGTKAIDKKNMHRMLINVIASKPRPKRIELVRRDKVWNIVTPFSAN